ncbi:MAG: DUF2314 domain-containing protein [Planctomycetota bacterium]
MLAATLPAAAAAAPPLPQSKSADAKTSGEARPAITLLYWDGHGTSATIIRSRLARHIGRPIGDKPTAKALWLQQDGTALIGGRGKHRFRIVRSDQALAVPDEAITHLDDATRDDLLAHDSHCVIECTASGESSRKEDYNLLGILAWAALSPNAIGYRLRDHGVFNPLTYDMSESLLGGDTLAQLEPEAHSSLIAFLATPPKLTEESVQRACDAAFGKNQCEVIDIDDGEFALVSDSEEPWAIPFVIVSLRQGSPIADFQSDNLRVRNAMRKHTHMLQIESSGKADEKHEQSRRRALARLMAELWSKDCMALSWHCNRRILPGYDEMPAQLRSQDPVRATLDSSVVPVIEATDKRAMQAAMKQARTTFAKAKAWFDGGGKLSVKFPFATRGEGEGEGKEHIWISVTGIDSNTVDGTIANEPLNIEGLELGSEVRRKITELSDWLYMENGEMVGGFTVKVLQAQAAKRKDK